MRTGTQNILKARRFPIEIYRNVSTPIPKFSSKFGLFGGGAINQIGAIIEVGPNEIKTKGVTGKGAHTC